MFLNFYFLLKLKINLYGVDSTSTSGGHMGFAAAVR